MSWGPRIRDLLPSAGGFRAILFHRRTTLFGVFGYRKITTADEEAAVAIQLAAQINAYERLVGRVVDRPTINSMLLGICKQQRMRFASPDQNRRVVTCAHALAGSDFIRALIQRWATTGDPVITPIDCREAERVFSARVDEFLAQYKPNK
jgi:hypothetical protein